MLALHIYNNKRKQSLSKFFFITFSLSTELLEDKQCDKLGGVDTSPTYLLFQTLLPLFWTLTCMIWMELTRTGTVFSRIAMVLFLCRNKVLRMTWKSMETHFGINKKYWRENQQKGAHTLATRVGGVHPASWPPGAPPTSTTTPYIHVQGEKKSERRIHHVLRYRDAVASCSSSGGQIWSLFGASERGIRCHRHHQPSSITNFMMLTAVRE